MLPCQRAALFFFSRLPAFCQTCRQRMRRMILVFSSVPNFRAPNRHACHRQFAKLILICETIGVLPLKTPQRNHFFALMFHIFRFFCRTAGQDTGKTSMPT